MAKILSEIARFIGGTLVGNGQLRITGVNGIKEAKKGELTFLANPKYVSLAQSTKASAIIVSRDLVLKTKQPLIKTDNPSLAFARAVSLFLGDQSFQLKGIHKTAVIAESAKLGKNVVIGPYVVIEEKAVVGDDTVIHAGSYVGYKTSIGKKCLIYPHVTIRERITIGSQVIIHSGTVIGSDGFGFADVDGIHEKIPQIGTVVIEDDVEIGANVTIDRARFDKTFIGRGTKIDNLVQIAHNVHIEENCIIVAQVGISGSVRVERGAILAGQAGIAGHLTIGEKAIVGAQAGVTKSVPARKTVLGFPARAQEEMNKAYALLHLLPKYVEQIRELKEKVGELEEHLAKNKKKT